jgi:hypothetical protein
MEPAPTPLWAPGQQPGWPHLADQPRDVPTQRVARLDAAVRVPKKPHVRDAKDASGRFLLGSSDSWDGRAGNLGVEPTGVPVAEHAVRDSGASIGPAGDRPTRPEIDVIGVSNYNQRTFDLVVSKNHDHSRQLA